MRKTHRRALPFRGVRPAQSSRTSERGHQLTTPTAKKLFILVLIAAG
ncbi:MAG TPA: hypothetical protein VEI97_01135 [bacterium]|nr:hypothetical protein [bacterium]